MFKKILTGLFLATVFGLLILGAVNRTMAKSNQDSPYTLNTNLAIEEEKSSSHESSPLAIEAQQNRTDNQAQANRETQDYSERSENGGLGEGLANVDGWVTSTGQVASITDELWVIELTDGSLLEFKGQMLSYLIMQGFSANIGDSLILTGFFDGDHYEVGQIQMVNSGEYFYLRDNNGRPLWAGNGRGKTGE